MAVVETFPRSNSATRPFQFWNLHHPLFPLMAVLLFAPLVEGGSTHLATMIIRLLILLALAVWCLQLFQSGKLAAIQINMGKPILLVSWTSRALHCQTRPIRTKVFNG